MKKITIRRAIIILIILSIVGVGMVFFLASRQKKISYKTVNVALGDIIQTVSETGTVKASTEISLSFLNNGKLQRQNFKVGDYVKKDQLLAELDYTALVISKQEAQANYDVATENLKKILAGATGEDRELAEATVKQAESAFASAKNEMSRVRSSSAESIAQAEKTLRDLQSSGVDNLTTYEQSIITAENNLNNTKSTSLLALNNQRDTVLTAIDDKISSVNSTLDAINRILSDEDIKDYLSVKNTAFKDLANNSYNTALKQRSMALNSLTKAKLTLSSDTVNSVLYDTLNLLGSVLSALNNTFSALENTVTGTTFTIAQLDAHKATVNANILSNNAAISQIKISDQNYKNAVLAYDTSMKSANDALTQAKSSLTSAITNAENARNSAKTSAEQQITSAQSRVNAAEEALQVAIAQSDRTLASANSFDITLNRAKIRQAQASLDSISKQIENSQIKAPIDGLITVSNFKVGEQVASGQAVFSILGDSGYKIEVLISEADINKVKVNDLSEVTLDAFGDEKIFKGIVTFIEPAETVIQEVIYYLVTVSFEIGEEKIKPGMTANITITTNQKTGVFTMPSRSVIDRGNEGKFVQLLVNNQVKDQKIVTGIRGDGGIIEVLDGLKVGDVIVTQIVEN